jgi:hypothetical protein
MTIYGTPGGTPLNYTGFQGTQPGNVAQAALQPLIPGVGLFPPNSNNFSGDTVQAATSRAALPMNALVSNEGIGITNSLSNGCPPLDGGVQSAPTLGVPFGAAPGGGAGATGGVGGSNMNSNVGAVGDVVLANQANPSVITYQGGGAQPTQFAG